MPHPQYTAYVFIVYGVQNRWFVSVWYWLKNWCSLLRYRRGHLLSTRFWTILLQVIDVFRTILVDHFFVARFLKSSNTVQEVYHLYKYLAMLSPLHLADNSHTNPANWICALIKLQLHQFIVLNCIAVEKNHCSTSMMFSGNNIPFIVSDKIYFVQNIVNR